MPSQVFHLQEAGIDCAYVSSGLDWMEQRSVFDRVRANDNGTIVLFVTPEKVRFAASKAHDIDNLTSWRVPPGDPTSL